ncbi:hypothetical protein KBD20_00070 [Candidatus Saccharibacteria bacterium]|nr:hypothetical protein [Candidatus Saccharibacteria bacterium]
MKHKIKNSRKEYKGAAPGLHNPAEHQVSLRDRKGALALLGLLTVGLLLHGLDPDSAENQPKRAKVGAESGVTTTPLQELMADGAEVRDEAVILRPGVRLYDKPVVIEVHNGKGPDGVEIPQLYKPAAVIKPAHIDGFIAVEIDGKIQYASEAAADQIVEGTEDTHYIEEIPLKPQSIADAEPLTLHKLPGGEPHVQSFLTTLDKLKSE